MNNMRWQHEVSVASFYFMLDRQFLFNACSGAMHISENLYPTMVGESICLALLSDVEVFGDGYCARTPI